MQIELNKEEAMKIKSQAIGEKIKIWWNTWSFVILFSFAILITLVGWKIVVGWFFVYSFWGILLSILFLFALLIFIISLILAISETNKYTVSFILLLFGTTTTIVGYYITNQSLRFDWQKVANDFYANISSEMIGIVVTVLVIESLATRLNWRAYVREEAQQEVEDVSTIKPEFKKVDVQETFPSEQNYFEKGVLIGAFFALVGIVFGYFLGRRD